MAFQTPYPMQTLLSLVSVSVVTLLLPMPQAQTQQAFRPFANSTALLPETVEFDFFLDPEPVEEPRNGGSRPVASDGFCAIAPRSNAATVWNIASTLTWQSPAGLITQIEIRSDAFDAENDESFRYAVSDEHIVRHGTEGDRPIHTYQLTLEQPLERGETYSWWFYHQLDDGFETQAPRFVRFQVMAAEESDRLTAALQDLGDDHGEQSVSEPEAIAQAEFLAQENLWADAWRVILDIPEPSEGLNEAVSDALGNLCPFESR